VPFASGARRVAVVRSGVKEVPTMTTTLQRAPAVPAWHQAVVHSLATPGTCIWTATAVIAVFAPDMVTGSEHEHLPIAGITVWLWASVATAYTALAVRRTPPGPTLVAGTSLLWAAVAVACVAGPVMVTGSDPTRIPMAVLVAPAVGALTTGFLALHHATSE
jgi:hypothetical protein